MGVSVDVDDAIGLIIGLTDGVKLPFTLPIMYKKQAILIILGF
jgi:hypothetical protein